MKKVAGLLKRRFENIITYLTHPITNATSESINAKIQWVKYTARGFRDKQNFIKAIYFHCGGLDLAPGTHSEPGWAKKHLFCSFN
jgi:transposase